MKLLGTILYQGKQTEIWLNPNQWESWRIINGKFHVNSNSATTNEALMEAYNKFCIIELRKIIEKQVAILRIKPIEVDVAYRNNNDNSLFYKRERHSVNDYLKLVGFSNEIECKIGKYEKEWGINQIDKNKKNFILHFNLDLIKFDSGEHIKYVVAHELAHVFHRDHGDKFQDALQRLYPNKAASESFFIYGIAALFGKQSFGFQYLVLILLALILIYWLYGQVLVWLNDFWIRAFRGSNYF